MTISRFPENIARLKIFMMLILKASGDVMCGFIVHTSTFSFFSIITFSLHAQQAPPPPHRWYDKVFNAEGVNFTNRADSFLSVIGVGCLWRSSGVWLISAAGYNKQYAAISVDICVICRPRGFGTGGEILSCVCVCVIITAVSSLFRLSTCACWIGLK